MAVATKAKEWIDFYFIDEESGELFFVELERDGRNINELRREATRIAKENFEDPRFQMTVKPEVAEAWGYDTY